MRSTSLLQSAAIGIIAAAIGVTIVFFIADAANGPLTAVGPSGDVEEIVAGAPAFAAIFVGLIGTLVAFLLRNRSNGAQVFMIITGVVLVLYGIWALAQADNLADGIWLNVMHVVAAVCITGMLTRWMQARGQVAA